jgi:hypothetical protein
MDFIEQLPPSAGYTAILVIVCRHSKQAIFIPCHDNIDTPELVRLFVLHVFSKHGVPEHITCDRGSEFISHFFRTLGAALKINLHYTSGYHPEANGGSERLNQTLETYLRMYCSYKQDNWSDLLAIAEFAYNNSLHETTGFTPFFVNKGYHPRIDYDPDSPYTSITARQYAGNLNALHETVAEHIKLANELYAEYANRKRIESPEFPDNSLVFVKSKYFCVTRPSHKLSDKYLGPYRVIKHAGSSSVVLELPHELRRVHPVFHVSMLEPFPDNLIPNRTSSPPPPVEIDDELEYEVTAIVGSRIFRGKLQYRVEWLGYEEADASERWTWESAKDLNHAQEAIAAFHDINPEAWGPLGNVASQKAAGKR